MPTSPTRRRSPRAARPLAETPPPVGGAHGFTTRQVADASGLPTSKILSWARAGLLAPVRDEDGAYVFSFQDLVLLRSARELLVADVPARKVRAALEALRQQLPSGRPLSAVHISAVGRAGLQTLAEGQKVSFEVQRGRDGRESAENLTVVE